MTVRLGSGAGRAGGAGAVGADVVELDDGTTAAGHVTLLAVGRTFPLDGLGFESVGLSPRELPRDGRLRIGDGLWLIGDPAGPELHTHQAHYQGELAVRMARGEPIAPDYRALPRATYTEPELASVGLTLEGAQAAGLDAFELVADFPTSIKGYSVEADFGHVTLVFDRASRELVGAAMAVPDASAAIHECVLAIKAHVPIDVLAETIHAFPSTSRILNGLFADARRAVRVDGTSARYSWLAARDRRPRRDGALSLGASASPRPADRAPTSSLRRRPIAHHDLVAGATPTTAGRRSRRRQPRRHLAGDLRTPRRPAIKQGETLLTPFGGAQALTSRPSRRTRRARAGLPPSQPGWIATHRALHADAPRVRSAIDDLPRRPPSEQFAKDFLFADYDALQQPRSGASGSRRCGRRDRLPACAAEP